MHSVGSRSYPLTRALVVGGYVIAVERARAWLMAPRAAATALVLGDAALAAAAAGWPPGKFGLARDRLWRRLLGGVALGAVLL